MASLLYQLKNFFHFEKSIFEKQNITILVTDSGIGGITVANDLYYFFQNNSYYKNVKIVFADCRNGNIGYNEIDDINKKIKIFSEQLFQLDKKINPDIIFIACNTLSILLNKTQFYFLNHKPIIDICGTSIDLMSKSLNHNDGLFILGTKTTIGQNYYKNTLIDMGFDKKNIVNQLCPNLARYIENSRYEMFFLQQNVKWLANRIKEKKPEHFKNYAISLNCTHYFYAIKYFKKYFSKIDQSPQIICPNFQMKNVFTNYLKQNNLIKTNVMFCVYKSKCPKSYKRKIHYFSNNKNLIFLV